MDNSPVYRGQGDASVAGRRSARMFFHFVAMSTSLAIGSLVADEPSATTADRAAMFRPTTRDAHALHQMRSQVQVLQSIIRWKSTASETTEEMFFRVRPPGKNQKYFVSWQQGKGVKAPTNAADELKLIMALYEEAQTARESANPAAVFAANIAKDPENAPWRRINYLAFVLNDPSLGLDVPLVEPLLDAAGMDADAALAMAFELLRGSVAARLPFDHPFMVKLRNLLSGGLSKRGSWKTAWIGENGELLLLLEQSCPDKRAAELDEFRELLLTMMKWKGYRRAVGHSEVARRRALEWSQRRKITVDFADAPLADVLDDVASQAYVMTWIDPVIRPVETRVTVKMSDTARAILDHVSRSAGLSIQAVSPELAWIGPQRRKEAFDVFARASNERFPSRGNTLECRDKAVSLEVAAKPLSRVLRSLSEQASVNILIVGPETLDVPVSLTGRCVPLGLSVASLCQQAEVEWSVDDDFILVGQPPEVAAMRQKLTTYRRRFQELQSHRQLAESCRALAKPVSFDLSATPLVDAGMFLQEYSGLWIAFPAAERMKGNRTTVTLAVRSTPLHLALSLLLAPHELDWQVGQGFVYVDTADRIADLKGLLAADLARVSKMRANPELIGLQNSLFANISFDSSVVDLDEAMRVLSDQCRRTIIFFSSETEVKRGEFLSANWRDQPLHVVLRIITFSFGLDWDTDGTQIFVSSAERLPLITKRFVDRKARRQSYPTAGIAKKLAAFPGVALERKLHKDMSVEELFVAAAEAVKLDLAVANKPTKTQCDYYLRSAAKSLTDRLSLDSFLDFICLETGADWQIVNAVDDTLMVEIVSP